MPSRMRLDPVLIVYATREGHTARVAKRLSAALVARDVLCIVEDADAHPHAVNPHRYSAVVVAGSVHFGRHAPSLVSYVESNRAALTETPNVFVSISMSEAIAHYTGATREQRAAARARAHEAADTFCVRTHFRPDHIQLLGGGLPYTRLGFFTRQLVRLISARQGGPTDPSRDHDLTDWTVLDSVADHVVNAIRPAAPARDGSLRA